MLLRICSRYTFIYEACMGKGKIAFSAEEQRAILLATQEVVKRIKPGRTHQPDYPGQIYRAFRYPDDALMRVEEWHWDWRGRLHRNPNEGPAHIIRDKNGIVHEEEYYWYGQHHRDNGPAHLGRAPDGFIYLENWYRYGRMHRDPADGPALQSWTVPGRADVISYYVHDFLFRDPRVGPMTYQVKNDQIVEPIYAKEIPPRPLPPINWLRKQYGRRKVNWYAPREDF
jgi:hypothetical protein